MAFQKRCVTNPITVAKRSYLKILFFFLFSVSIVIIKQCTSFVPSLVMVDKTCRELYCVSSFFILFSSFSPSGREEKETKLFILQLENS